MNAPTAPAIEGENLTRRFGSTTALDSVNLAVQPNTVCGLLGRNGAGKTTLMSLITGQDRATSGRILVNGRSPFENAPTLAGISFIRDNQRYPDDFTLRYALKSAAMFRPHWDADFAHRLADAFRLPPKTAIKKYSRGQASALAIVLGLAARTPITLLDEPYLGLDATARQMFYDLLLDEQLNHPRTFLISTHLVSEMESIFDRVIVLDSGRVVMDSSMDDLHGQFALISGVKSQVDAHTLGMTEVHKRVVGGLVSVLVQGSIPDEQVAAMRSAGLDVSPADLQSVVTALGAHSTDLDAESADSANDEGVTHV